MKKLKQERIKRKYKTRETRKQMSKFSEEANEIEIESSERRKEIATE